MPFTSGITVIISAIEGDKARDLIARHMRREPEEVTYREIAAYLFPNYREEALSTPVFGEKGAFPITIEPFAGRFESTLLIVRAPAMPWGHWNVVLEKAIPLPTGGIEATFSASWSLDNLIAKPGFWADEALIRLRGEGLCHLRMTKDKCGSYFIENREAALSRASRPGLAMQRAEADINKALAVSLFGTAEGLTEWRISRKNFFLDYRTAREGRPVFRLYGDPIPHQEGVRFALCALGWTTAELSKAAGINPAYLRKMLQPINPARIPTELAIVVDNAMRDTFI